MRNLAFLLVRLIMTIARLFGPGGARSIVAESLRAKHQLLILNRSRERAPKLRIFEITEVKTVPYVPLSHPVIGHLIGTIRREFLDHVPFWNARDLRRKLLQFKEYYNRDRVHRGLGGTIPIRDRQNNLENCSLG